MEMKVSDYAHAVELVLADKAAATSMTRALLGPGLPAKERFKKTGRSFVAEAVARCRASAAGGRSSTAATWTRC
jgi:hypothetical protein